MSTHARSNSASFATTFAQLRLPPEDGSYAGDVALDPLVAGRWVAFDEPTCSYGLTERRLDGSASGQPWRGREGGRSDFHHPHQRSTRAAFLSEGRIASRCPPSNRFQAVPPAAGRILARSRRAFSRDRRTPTATIARRNPDAGSVTEIA